VTSNERRVTSYELSATRNTPRAEVGVNRFRAFAILIVATVCIACRGNPPEPPVVTPPSGSETIHGSERIGWDQRAGDPIELAAIRYAVYVDGARSELTGVNCATTATATGYACTARLPPMSAGNHSVEIASFIQDGGILESARSAALRVTVTAAAAAAVPSP
jgi:hypothetical protein